MYNDKDDLFAREPFVAQFTLPSKGRTAEGWGVGGRQWSGAGGSTRPALVVLPSLVLVPLHTTPKAVEKELNALYDVFLDVTQHWQTEVWRMVWSGWGCRGSRAEETPRSLRKSFSLGTSTLTVLR